MTKASKEQKRKIRNIKIDNYVKIITEAMIAEFKKTENYAIALEAGNVKRDELAEKYRHDKDLIVKAAAIASQKF